MAKNASAGSKRNKNAAQETVEISTGKKILVQEFAVRNTISILGLVKKVLNAVKGKDFNTLETAGDATLGGLSSLIDWAAMGAEILEANYDEVLGLIVSAQVNTEGTDVLDRNDLDDVLLDDVIQLILAIYRVNFVEGSLKKYVTKLFPKTETVEGDEKEQSEN